MTKKRATVVGATTTRLYWKCITTSQSKDIVPHFQFFVKYFLTTQNSWEYKKESGNTMSTILNVPQKGETDVFRSFLVKNAMYEGVEEIPKIRTSNYIPEKVISFSKAVSGKVFNRWVHFYERDEGFERLWRTPQKYLPILKRFQGMISPDYSLYYDMPLCMQIWNIYRGRALAHWFQENGVEVIPNIRWGDERTFKTACLGVESGKTIAVGTHGCIKTVEGRKMFIAGFDYAINKLKPKNIIVYGRIPDKIFGLARMYSINLLLFESEFSLSRKKGVS